MLTALRHFCFERCVHVYTWSVVNGGEVGPAGQYRRNLRRREGFPGKEDALTRGQIPERPSAGRKLTDKHRFAHGASTKRQEVHCQREHPSPGSNSLFFFGAGG